MKTGNFAIFITTILIVQLGIFASLGIQQFAPNLILFTLIWFTFNVTLWDALLAATALGLFLDIYTVAPFGFNVTSAIIMVFLLFWIINNWLPKEERFYIVIGTLIFTTLFYQVIGSTLYFGLSVFSSELEFEFSRFFNQKLILQLVLNVLFYYPFTAVCRKFLDVVYEQKSLRN